MPTGDNRDELERLLVEHQTYLRKAAFFLVRGTTLDALDLLQRTNELVIRNEHQWKGFAFRKWSHKILFNEYRAEKRRLRESQAITFDDDAWASIEDEDATNSTQAMVESLAFESLMARLSSEHREVLMLISIEGFTYGEAAEMLGVPEGTVTSRLKRAKRRYQELLDELREQDEATT